MFKQSTSFYANLLSEEYESYAGVNEFLSEKELPGGPRGAHTDYSSGVSFRDGNVITTGVGWGRMTFQGAGIIYGQGRGMGIVQSASDPKRFLTCWAYPDVTVSPDVSWASNSFLDPSATTSIFSASSSDLPDLVSSVKINGYDILADGARFKRVVQGTTDYCVDVINKPAPPPGVNAVAAINQVYYSQFGSLGNGQGQFSSVGPYGIATDSGGNVFVVDNGNSRVQKFTAGGDYISEFTYSGFSSQNQTFLFIDGSDNIYIGSGAISGIGAVFKFNSSGVYQSSFTGSPAMALPNSMSVDSGGHFWVIDGVYANIQKFDATGAYISTLAPSGAGLSPLNTPFGLYIDGSNNFYVTDTSTLYVQKLNSSGVYQSKFRVLHNNPYSVTSDGTNIFVCVIPDGASALTNVWVMDLALANIITSFGGLGPRNEILVNGGYYLAFKGNKFYVSAYFSPHVSVFTLGKLTGYYGYCYTLIDSYGNESQPSGMATIKVTDQQVSLSCYLNGLQALDYQFTTIRIYRTLSSQTQILAADNPTFFHLVGLDITPIDPSVSTYTVYDGVQDSEIDTSVNPNNYELSNVAFSNGQLTDLSANMVPKFVAFAFGVPLAANWKNTNTGDAFPRRLYWGFTSDNSQSAPANCLTWSTENFEDVGQEQDGEIIGIYGGLQGYFFIFCQNATYAMQATGNPLLPYSFTQTSGKYGFFHHSIADCGTFAIGRTTKGYFKFNGYVYTPISTAIPRTVARCIYPQGDSAVYDPTTQRYITVVCDQAILGSFAFAAQIPGPSFVQSLVAAPRNKMLVYNVVSQSWENHGDTGLQVLGSMRDTNGLVKIFGLGLASDIHFITQEGAVYGAVYNDFNSCEPPGNKFQLTDTATKLVGRTMFIPYVTDGSVTFSFSDFQSDITSVDGGDPTIAYTDGFLTTFPGGGDLTAMICVANNAGTITRTSDTTIEDTNNVFSAGGHGAGFLGIANLNPTTLAIENVGLGNLHDYTTYSDPHNLVFTDSDTGGVYTCVLGQIYAVIPYRFVNYANASFYQFPLWCDVMLPPYGYRQPHDRFSKSFQQLELYIRGSGELLLEFFLDGSWNPLITNPVPDASKVITLRSADKMARIQVDLPNLIGRYLRVRVRCIRGRTTYVLNQSRCLYRLQEAFGGK